MPAPAATRTTRHAVRWIVVALLGIAAAVVVALLMWRVFDGMDAEPHAGAPVVIDATDTPVAAASPTPDDATAEPTPVRQPPTPTTSLATPTATAPVATAPVANSIEVIVHAAHGRPSDFSDPHSERVWLDTGVVLTGEPVELTARGFVSQHEDGDLWPPEGMGTEFCMDVNRPCTAPRLSQFALIGRVEGERWPFLVGAGTTVTATGRLFLAFNDGYYEDNCLQRTSECGEWTVTIDGVFERDPR